MLRLIASPVPAARFSGCTTGAPSQVDGYIFLFLLCLSEHLLLLLSHFSCVRLCATPQTAAYQAPLSLGFSRQEYWSGLVFPSQGNLPNPEIETGSHVSCIAGRFFTDLSYHGIPAELSKILKDNAVKVLRSICQQIWKTQPWPQD